VNNTEMNIRVVYHKECGYTVILKSEMGEAALECLSESEVKRLSFADMLECMEYGIRK